MVHRMKRKRSWKINSLNGCESSNIKLEEKMTTRDITRERRRTEENTSEMKCEKGMLRKTETEHLPSKNRSELHGGSITISCTYSMMSEYKEKAVDVVVHVLQLGG